MTKLSNKTVVTIAFAIIIFGFILGSLPELFPQDAAGNYLLCGVCVAVGFLLAYAIGKRERSKEE